jgi:Amt family ammonium transporter
LGLALTEECCVESIVAGIVGLIFTGVFAQASVTANDAFTVIPGGWLDQNYRQVGIQLVYIIVVWLYTFFMTYAIMIVIDHIPYCHFRCSEEAEIIGVDEDQCGEFAVRSLSNLTNGLSILTVRP